MDFIYPSQYLLYRSYNSKKEAYKVPSILLYNILHVKHSCPTVIVLLVLDLAYSAKLFPLIVRFSSISSEPFYTMISCEKQIYDVSALRNSSFKISYIFLHSFAASKHLFENSGSVVLTLALTPLRTPSYHAKSFSR